MFLARRHGAASIISDDAAEPRLRRVAVRRGFRLFVEVRREVGGRHVYFVERRARERADELQCLLCRDLVFSQATQATAWVSSSR